VLTYPFITVFFCCKDSEPEAELNTYRRVHGLMAHLSSWAVTGSEFILNCYCSFVPQICVNHSLFLLQQIVDATWVCSVTPNPP
jgi:hypothetical protein